MECRVRSKARSSSSMTMTNAALALVMLAIGCLLGGTEAAGRGSYSTVSNDGDEAASYYVAALANRSLAGEDMEIRSDVGGQAEVEDNKEVCIGSFCIGRSPFRPGWCVAKPGTSQQQLQSMLQRACSMGVNCLAIEPGHPCYDPNNLLAHTSWAINQYYFQKIGHCNFEGSAIIVDKDPSSGTCVFPRTR